MTGAATAPAVGESRTVKVAAGKFSDACATGDMHIYQINLTVATCP